MLHKSRKRILITGGSGFVGGHVIDQALGEWEIYATYQKHPFTIKGVNSIQLDLENDEKIFKAVKDIQPDVMVHTAACSDIDLCEKNKIRTFRINSEVTAQLAQLSTQIGCRMIYISSDMVYDGEKGNYSETDKTQPISVYGKSKLVGEENVIAYASNYAIARLALVYGPPKTGSNSFSEKILERVRRGKTMPLFTDQYRSPILVSNAAEALLELAESDFNGILNLGGSEKVDRYSFGLQLAEVRGFDRSILKPVSMSEVSFGVQRPRDISMDVSKATSILKTELLDCQEGLTKAYS